MTLSPVKTLTSGAVKSALLFLLPLSALCLLVYWPALKVWFYQDDFAWLAIPLDLKTEGLLRVLFRPQAQGTVRVLSERLFFLGGVELFGMDSLPFKAIVFGTQFLNLMLLAAIAHRLTCSRMAAYAAAIAWLFNSALSTPLSWLSAYNEVLWTLVVLSAFYCLLKYTSGAGWQFNAAQWVIYLLGFGVLELNVVYPALATLYAFCLAPRYAKQTIALFVPAIVFALIHILFIPNTAPSYQMHFDASIAKTLGKYIGWALGPSRIGGLVDPAYRPSGYLVTAAVGLALAVFVLRKRNGLAIFLCGWFLIVLAPVLALRDHMTDYYLMVAIIGPCILAGWAFANALEWRGTGAIAVVLLIAYCAGHYMQFRSIVDYRLQHSRRMRDVMDGVEAVYRKSPKPLVLLTGVDWDLYAAGFNDRPFRLLGINNVYLMPGSEPSEAGRDALLGIERYKISRQDAFAAVRQNKAVVIALGDGRLSNVTSIYGTLTAGEQTSALPTEVDVGLPASAAALGEGWHSIENGFRWSQPTAVIHLAAPRRAGAKLLISGYCPAAVIAEGPVTLDVQVNGTRVGQSTIRKGDEGFELSFALPAVSVETLEITLSTSRATIMPGDGRKLGLIFGKFAVK